MEAIGNIKVLAGPSQVGGPDDLLTTIIGFIDEAQKKLSIAIQELDSEPIAKAIIAAKQRGVQVRIVLEADYLLAKKSRPDPFSPGGQHEINRTLHDAILRAKIRVNSDFNPKIFHQKFIIRDNKAVLTGSTNFTATGTEQNLNHLIIIEDAEVAKIYAKEFREIRQGHFGKLNEGHDPRPKEITVSGVRVKVLFAPDHNPEMEIMKQIAKAKQRIDFAIFTFSESSGIDDQLVLAHNAGITVRGALFKSQANQTWSAKETLRDSGIELHAVPRAGIPAPRPRKLHHKLMIIDEQLIIAGSFNYTKPANLFNDENIIILGDLDNDEPTVRQKQGALASFALQEIDRIISRFGEPIPLT